MLNVLSAVGILGLVGLPMTVLFDNTIRNVAVGSGRGSSNAKRMEAIKISIETSSLRLLHKQLSCPRIRQLRAVAK